MNQMTGNRSRSWLDLDRTDEENRRILNSCPKAKRQRTDGADCNTVALSAPAIAISQPRGPWVESALSLAPKCGEETAQPTCGRAFDNADQDDNLHSIPPILGVSENLWYRGRDDNESNRGRGGGGPEGRDGNGSDSGGGDRMGNGLCNELQWRLIKLENGL